MEEWEGNTPQVTEEILQMLGVMQGEMKRVEIQAAQALKDRKHFQAAYLCPALAGNFMEMTIPEKPLSSRQRYRLTRGAAPAAVIPQIR